MFHWIQIHFLSSLCSKTELLICRGNAVMRSKARKQDVKVTSEDVSIHIGLGRTNRSKGKIIIWRLLRALRALMIIAAFNVPLYVLLVFKDWIDK